MSDHPDNEMMERRRERRRYLAGGVITLVLTLLAFALAAWPLLGTIATRAALCLLALLQIIAHFHFFLHIDLRKSHRDDLMLILFTGLIALLMIAGTIWILFDQWTRMM